jgi:peptidoglycan/xylan/chitin deacetylase (PgdA/CDA1 family)
VVQATVALRIDVDTRRGLQEGVPRLLTLLRRRGVRASFYVTMGPDRSGLALRRAWRPGFVAKMWRSRAWRLYGLRTALSGTLLPAAPVGAGFPGLLRDVLREGHELAPHGHDHVRWQDRVHRLSDGEIRADLAAAAAAFESAAGVPPHASAAPGWRITPGALAIQEEFGYRYATDTRGRRPFRPLLPGGPLKTVQIPTTMPTMDELLGRVRDPARALEGALGPGLNVLTAHAEVEGGPLLEAFDDFLERVQRRGLRTARLDEVAGEAGAPAPAAVGRGRVAGRSGWVAVAEEAG